MNKLAVFDIDNVLADFEGQLVGWLAAMHGKDAYLNRHLYSIDERFEKYPEIAKDAAEFVSDPNSYYGLPPIDSMLDFAQSCEAQGAVFYVSARPTLAQNFTVRWLKRYGLLSNFTLHHVFCGVGDKPHFLKDLVDGTDHSVDFIVEDSPGTVYSLRDSFTVLTLDRPWNKGLYPRLRASEGVLTYQSESTDAEYPIEMFKETQ